MTEITIQKGDCLDILETYNNNTFDFVYLDPPFNRGYGHYNEEGIGYSDDYDDYWKFLRSRLYEIHRVLKPNGSMIFHIDWHLAHYVKVLILDIIFGSKNCMNEIIWAYDYGGRPKKRWAQKHDTLFWYVKDQKDYTFNLDASDRIPYLAPDLVGTEKAVRGKTPTDVWWHTIVPTNSKEKTGYPTQKPLGILRRIIAVHSNPGDLVLDPFAGSGTTGAACKELGRSCVLIDSNPQAIKVMQERLQPETN